jgi:hypothetical protein
MELFDVIKTIFKKDKDWDKVSRNDKVRNFFMINRIMSVQFPIQAQQFNHTKVLPRPVVDWWHATLSKHYTKMPGWIFTKTKKSKNNTVSTLDYEADPLVERFILNRFEISKRELSDLKKFYPEKYKEWVESIKEQIDMTKK